QTREATPLPRHPWLTRIAHHVSRDTQPRRLPLHSLTLYHRGGGKRSAGPRGRAQTRPIAWLLVPALSRGRAPGSAKSRPELRFDHEPPECEALLDGEQKGIRALRNPLTAGLVRAEEEDVVAEAEDDVVVELPLGA